MKLSQYNTISLANKHVLFVHCFIFFSQFYVLFFERHPYAAGYPAGFVHHALPLCTPSCCIMQDMSGEHMESMCAHIHAGLLAQEVELKYEVRLIRNRSRRGMGCR